ncbi:MAG: hypothetical protein V1838_03285 [Patescibacteria group bacterium]
MKLYFYGAPTNRVDLDNSYGRIKRLLRQTGAELTASTERLETTMTKEELEKLKKAGEIALDKMDAFIIEGSEADAQAGYLLAFAVARQKPTLYLYERRGQLPVILKNLDKKSIPKTLEVKGYLKENLDEILQNFLRGLGSLKVEEVPNIKFTLRITKTIEKYLHYKTHNTDKSKADFIREEIDGKMKKDSKFWDWLKKQREN